MTKLKAIKGVALDDLVQDPYPIYERMRAMPSPCYLPQLDRIVAARTDDIQFIQSNLSLFATADADAPYDTKPNSINLDLEDSDIATTVRHAVSQLADKSDPDLLPDLIDPLLAALSESCLLLSTEVKNIVGHTAATTLAGLLENRDQLLAVQFQDDWNHAIEEAIRWCNPLQFKTYTTLQDTAFRRYSVPKDTKIICAHASANHDPKIWKAGNLFNAYRGGATQKNWNNGLTLIRPMMDRLMGKFLLPILFDAFPDMELKRSMPPKWAGFRLRGPTSLNVKLQ